MDEIENKPATQAAQPIETVDLRQQYEALRHLVISVLILLIVVSGTLSVYLLRQYRNTSKDLEGFRPYAQNIIGTYQNGDGPAVQNFIGRVVDYGRTHPDFVPILKRYNISPGPASGAPL